jgi:hypothetical protein
LGAILAFPSVFPRPSRLIGRDFGTARRIFAPKARVLAAISAVDKDLDLVFERAR